MTLLRNKWLLTGLVFLFAASAAWSQSLGTSIGIFTEAGQLSPEWWRPICAYSAILVPLDTVFTVAVVYYFGKGLKAK